MSRTQRFFRGLWRVNAVLLFLLVAGLVLTLGGFLFQEIRSSLRDSASVLASIEADHSSSEVLEFDNASVVPGTGVVTVDLVTRREGKGPSSGQTSVTRNILFIESDQKSGHWLLNDNAHCLSEEKYIYDKAESDEAKTLGAAVVVRAADAEPNAPGSLIVYDRAGRGVVELSNSATELKLASLTGKQITVVYRANDRLRRATLDPSTFAKIGDVEVDIPKLK